MHCFLFITEQNDDESERCEGAETSWLKWMFYANSSDFSLFKTGKAISDQICLQTVSSIVKARDATEVSNLVH